MKRFKITEEQYKRLMNEMRYDGKSTGLFQSEEPVNEEKETNYMVIQNLRQIKKDVTSMLLICESNPEQFDNIMGEHPWAVDHITTSKDDIEEVANFLMNVDELSETKIPKKYLTKDPKEMKKEIEKYKGERKVFKQKWDADYKGKGLGKGERYETKTGEATKAYHKKYGKK